MQSMAGSRIHLMNLYPAVDILNSRAVRLTKGDFAASKVYDEDPFAAAQAWIAAGATHLHIVDLDGAREGTPRNLEKLRKIAAELEVPTQFGGGLRTPQAITSALEAGASRVILGTAAFTQPQLLEQALVDHGPARIVVSVDVRGGKVATAGWTQTRPETGEDVVAELHERGVREFIYTNVDRDGMLEGPDLEEVRRVADAVQGRFIYSGGIGNLSDLEGLVSLEAATLEGVIVGKALYERRFTVAEANSVLTASR